jgi:protein-S-isoprenylcysteine O-methyltransferase Ste14
VAQILIRDAQDQLVDQILVCIELVLDVVQFRLTVVRKKWMAYDSVAPPDRIVNVWVVVIVWTSPAIGADYHECPATERDDRFSQMTLEVRGYLEPGVSYGWNWVVTLRWRSRFLGGWLP